MHRNNSNMLGFFAMSLENSDLVVDQDRCRHSPHACFNDQPEDVPWIYELLVL